MKTHICSDHERAIYTPSSRVFVRRGMEGAGGGILFPRVETVWIFGSCYIERPAFKFVILQVVHTLSLIIDFLSSAFVKIDTLVN